MTQLQLFEQSPPPLPAPLPAPRPAPKPVDLPPVKHGGRPEVCYRNPGDLMQSWTGRGKPPRWITEWVESGKSLDALRVPGTKL